jgi:hypothetical protein
MIEAITHPAAALPNRHRSEPFNPDAFAQLELLRSDLEPRREARAW